MSMNLYAEVTTHDLDLWLTPTAITEIICVNKNGLFNLPLTGNKAKRALQAYLIWASHTCDGAWDDNEDYKKATDARDEHIKDIQFYINDDSLKVTMR